ncbi:MAG: hypothetical protein ACI94Y_003722 [Maribacter sp.]|jgi:hypothetical protein
MKMSSINKINYEQFAMDYLEGNLSGNLLQEMNAFLEKNPAIKKELDGMELFYLEADESIVFEEKETLLKPVSTRKIFFFLSIFLIASCLLVGVFVSVLFLMDNNIENKNEIAIEKNIIINNEENEIVNNEKEIIEEIKKDKPLIIEKIIEEDVLNKSLPFNPSIKPLDNEQPIANHKEKSIPVYQEKPIEEQPKSISPIIPEKIGNQSIASNSEPEDKTEENQTIRETTIIAAIGLASIDDSFNHDVQLSNTMTVVDEFIEPEKQSRLARIGLIPGNEGRRKISFKTIKEALIPEGLALRE